MNVKRTIAVLLAVFLVLAGICGAASAGALDVKNPAVITPSDALTPGDHVTGTVQINISKESIDSIGRITFVTPLLPSSGKPLWTVTISTGGAPLATKHPSDALNYISQFDIDYGANVTLDVFVEGTVPLDAGGKDVSIMNITAKSADSGILKSYTSTPQRIYDPSNVPVELNALDTKIQNLDARISQYVGYGWDVKDAQNALEQTRSEYNAAVAAGSDTKTAFRHIDNANSKLKDAEMKLDLASLSLTLSYTDYISNTINVLYAKGWTNEAVLLDTKNTALKNSYTQLLATYQAGNAPDANQLDTLAADSVALYTEAQTYAESAGANPFEGVLKFLPFILIGLGVVAVIIVVIVIIIRKRKNSWDELG